MKDKAVAKLEKRLALAEAELRDALLQVLPAAAKSGADLFTTSRFKPAQLNTTHFHPRADELLKAAEECEDLKEKLGDTTVGLGYLYLQACREASSNNQQRRGPRRLAQWLLAEIGHDAQQGVPADGPRPAGSARR